MLYPFRIYTFYLWKSLWISFPSSNLTIKVLRTIWECIYHNYEVGQHQAEYSYQNRISMCIHNYCLLVMQHLVLEIPHLVVQIKANLFLHFTKSFFLKYPEIFLCNLCIIWLTLHMLTLFMNHFATVYLPKLMGCYF